jgi:hypothetical protein
VAFKEQVIMKKLFPLLISIIITAFLMESVLRLNGYGPFIYNPDNKGLNINAYFLVADSFLGFKNRSNGSYAFTYISGSPLITTDNFGYRTSFPSGSNTDPYIIFVGDSTVFCGEVNDFETGPSEVAKLLKANGISVNVINAGVRAYNTLQSKRMMELILNKYNNIFMVIYVYCDNDFVENLNPIAYFPIKAPTVWIDKETGKKIEIEVQSQIVPWGKGFDTLIGSSECMLKSFFSYSHSALFYHSYQLIMGTYNNFHKVSRLHVLEPGSMGPVVSGSPEYEKQLLWAKNNGSDILLKQLLIEMNQMCSKKFVKFITTRYTTGHDFSINDYYNNLCQTANVKYVSLINKFDKDKLFYTAKIASQPRHDRHYNQKGTITFAEGLLPTIISLIHNN